MPRQPARESAGESDPASLRVGAGEATFYIPATNAPSRPRRNLKYNDTFAVFDSHGDIGASAAGQDGLFDHDTRFLSHLELLIAGSRPLLLHSAVSDENLSYFVDLTNPDVYADGEIVLLKDTVHVSRTIYLCDGSLRERIALVNHGHAEVSFTLSITFASDFADIFEVRGIRRQRRGHIWSHVQNGGEVVLCYRGLDAIVRRTTVSFDPPPAQLQESAATYRLSLRPHERCTVFISVTSGGGHPSTTNSFFRGLMSRRRDLKSATSGIATVETDNSLVNEILARSAADLYMLATHTQEGFYPYAGIPWYSTAFGRDGIITAMEMLWFDPNIARGVLSYLARLQAKASDVYSDAEPGKILHEMRGGEMAALREVPFRLYYGTVDATPLFVMLAGQYVERTGDAAFIAELWPSIEAALGWIDGAGDQDADGFVEYARGAETGLSNQGWKDSHDSIFHADGLLAKGPIALVEVQAYVYAARLAAARCARSVGRMDAACALEEQAAQLRGNFERAFWSDRLGFYAIALDGDKKHCDIRASNAGHALWCGIAAPERARAVAAKLMTADFFSGWGIRTVAEGEARYNPMSYHNGSVWPHDNALIAAGLARYGEKRGAADVFEALIRATSYFDQRRIPELYCGFRRRPGRAPTLYPAACSPQAWSAGAPFLLIQSMLGLEFRPSEGEIRLVNPIVPRIAGAITVRNVRLNHASADFTLRPSAGGVSLEVLKTTGNLRIALVVD